MNPATIRMEIGGNLADNADPGNEASLLKLILALRDRIKPEARG